MFEIKRVLERLPQALEERVLPNLGTGLKLVGALCYGSRVNGGARPNSDLDILIVVETGNDGDFYSEFHGDLKIGDGTLPVEIRAYSKSRLMKILDGEDAKRLFALKNAIVVYDVGDTLKDFAVEATAKFSQLMKDFIEELGSLSTEEVLPLLQIGGSESFAIGVELAAQRQGLAAIVKFWEFIADYIVYSEACWRILHANDNMQIWSEESVANLYFLRADKGGRFLNTLKYDWPERFASLIQELNSHFADSKSVASAFDILDSHFNSLFGRPLLLKDSHWPAVVLK